MSNNEELIQIIANAPPVTEQQMADFDDYMRQFDRPTRKPKASKPDKPPKEPKSKPSKKNKNKRKRLSESDVESSGEAEATPSRHHTPPFTPPPPAAPIVVDETELNKKYVLLPPPKKQSLLFFAMALTNRPTDVSPARWYMHVATQYKQDDLAAYLSFTQLRKPNVESLHDFLGLDKEEFKDIKLDRTEDQVEAKARLDFIASLDDPEYNGALEHFQKEGELLLHEGNYIVKSQTPEELMESMIAHPYARKIAKALINEINEWGVSTHRYIQIETIDLTAEELDAHFSKSSQSLRIKRKTALYQENLEEYRAYLIAKEKGFNNVSETPWSNKYYMEKWSHMEQMRKSIGPYIFFADTVGKSQKVSADPGAGQEQLVAWWKSKQPIPMEQYGNELERIVSLYESNGTEEDMKDASDDLFDAMFEVEEGKLARL
jgi:hypothetical protein